MSNWRSSPSTPRPICEDPVERHAAGAHPPVAVEQRTRDPADEVGLEPLVAGRDGRVDREHAVALDLVQRGVQVATRRPRAPGHARRAGTREWPSLRCQTAGLDAEGPDRPGPADAEDELLVQPHLAAADVQDVADRPVGVVVLGHVRVEQEHGHPPDLDEPDRDRQRPAGQLDRHLERVAARVGDPEDRQAGEVEVGVGVLLVAVGVDRLAEVALAVHEPDADERQGHVAGRLHVVAGEDAEPARVDAEALVEAVLGAEVGDRALRARRRGGGGTSGRRRWTCTGRSRR